MRIKGRKAAHWIQTFSTLRQDCLWSQSEALAIALNCRKSNKGLLEDQLIAQITKQKPLDVSSRFFFWSILTIGLLTLIQCKLEYFLYPENVVSSMSGSIVGIVYLFIAARVRRGHHHYQKLVIPMIITGVPIVSERILWTTGMSGSTVVWFAIMPMYTMLFGPRKWLKAIYAYLVFGFIATYAIQEYYGDYFHPLQAKFPSVLGMSLTVVGMVALVMHIYLYELSRQAQERTIIKQKGEIESSRRLAVVGELAGGVAHEINNPLATLQLVTEMLKEQPEKWTNQVYMDKQLQMISNVTDRITTTVKSLMNFSRTNSSENFHAIAVGDLVKQVVALCSFQMKKREVQILYELNGHESDLIHCRSEEIQQAIITLLVNASEAVEGMPAAWIRLEFRQEKDQFIFEVSDSGNKIMSDIAEQMFEPYYTTKEFGKGMGLGLSIALGLVRGHAGDLVYDAKQQHTTFQIRLPKAGLAKLAAVQKQLAS